MSSLKDMFRMENRIAIITGGHTGLGYDMACALAEYGCTVIITSRSQEKAASAAKKLKESYACEAAGYALEQTDPDSCQRLLEEVRSAFGSVDILINNAGGGSGAGECNFLKRSPADMKHMIDVNLVGVLYCCQAACKIMAEQRSGVIVNIASIAALVGRDRELYHSAGKMEQPVEYAAAKSGVLGLTRDLAAFMAPYQVRVNAISPGGFDKGELTKAFVDAYSALTPLKKMGTIRQDIKGAVLLLCSDAASYITGQNIVVDGGFSICK